MNPTAKDQPSAWDAWESVKAARKKAALTKDARDAEFDRFLETSDRPITFRDLMFSLAVLSRIAGTCVRALEEILKETPPEQRFFEPEASFDEMEHSNLRDALFELYYSHGGVKLSEEFWKAYDPWQEAHQLETDARRAYQEARKREGLQRGESPKKPA